MQTRFIGDASKFSRYHEIENYENTTVFVWNWRSRTVTIQMKIGKRKNFENIHLYLSWPFSVQPFVLDDILWCMTSLKKDLANFEQVVS